MNPEEQFNSYRNGNNPDTIISNKPNLPKGKNYGENYIPLPSTTLEAKNYSKKDLENFQSYGVDIKFSQTNPYEQLGQRQSTAEKIFNGASRLLGTTITKTLSGIGYVGGFIGYGLTGFQDISTMTDNGFSAFFNSMEEDIKEGVPIFTPPSVSQGNILDKMGSTSWWMDQGVDGASYLLSAMIPGIGLSKLGTGAAIASRLGKGVAAARNIDIATATVFSTISESAVEAKQVQDQVRSSYKEKIQQGLISEQEVEEKAATAARNTFTLNSIALIVPNLIQSKLLLGNNTQKGFLGKLFDKKGNLIENAGKLSKKELAKTLGKSVGLGFAREGFYEENIQLAISDYETEVAKGNADSNRVKSIMENMYNNLFTDEGQENIALGGILGGGTAVVGSVRGKIQEKKIIQRAQEFMNNHISNYTNNLKDSIKNIYQTDEEGNIKLDDKGSPLIDNEKAVEIVSSLTKEAQNQHLKEAAILSGNTDLYQYIRNLEFTNFALPFLMEEGGLEILNRQIDNIQEDLLKENNTIDPSSKATLTYDMKNRASELYDIAQTLKDRTGIYNFDNRGDINAYDQWLKNYQYNLVSQASKIYFLRDKFNDTNKKYQEVLSKYKLYEEATPLANEVINRRKRGDKKRELIENNNTALSLEKEILDNLENKLTYYENTLEDAENEYKKIANKTQAELNWNQYKDFKDKIKEDEQDIENNVEEEKDKVNNQQQENNQVQDNLTIQDLYDIQNSQSTDNNQVERQNVNNEDINKIIQHIKDNEIDPQKKVIYNDKEYEVETISLLNGKAIIKDGNQGLEVDILKLTKPVNLTNEELEISVSSTMTNNPETTSDKKKAESDTKLKNNLDNRFADFLGKVTNVIMHKQFQHTKLGKFFYFNRNKEGLPIEANSANVDFEYVNNQSSLAVGSDLEFRLVEDEDLKQSQKESINKSIQNIRNSDLPYADYPNYGFGNEEIIGIYQDNKLVGFVQLPHSIEEGHKEEFTMAWLVARQKLIERRINIISKLKNGEKVLGKVTIKGKGNYFTRIKEDKAVKTKIENRDQDLVNGNKVFVISDGEKLILPDIPEFGKKAEYTRLIQDIKKDISGYTKYGVIGQVFMLVKSANNTWSPIPIYTNTLNASVVEKILDIIDNNVGLIDPIKLIAELQPYLYSSINKKAGLNIKEENDVLYLTIDTIKYTIDELINNSKRRESFKNSLSKLHHNLDANRLNTSNYQKNVLDNNDVLNTTAITVDGQYFFQPYIEYNVNTYDIVGLNETTTSSEPTNTEVVNNIVEQSDDELLDSLLSDRGLDINNNDNIAFKRKDKISDKEVEDRIKNCK
jgi:hypothetical protein